MSGSRAALLLASVFCAGAAHAHGFGRLYNLPVPFWLYAWGASGALLLSFVVSGFLLTTSPGPSPAASRSLVDAPWVRVLRRARLLAALKVLAVVVLLLSIATGFFGSRDPYRNFSMTAFWIGFVLAFAYLTALIGDLYAAINPWRLLARGIERAGLRRFAHGRVRYPAALGDWPALVLYLLFIGVELFGTGRPRSLATLLAAYTALNLAGVWLVGAAAWFRHCEFFAVFLRLIARMAPIEYRPAERSGERGVLRWRLPFAGLVTDRPAHLSTVTFVLAMLATTAFDGLRATQAWVALVWQDPTGIVTALLGTQPIRAYVTLLPWYRAWEMLWLAAAPFAYLAVYLAFIALARWVTRSDRSVRELALDFGYTLLPIAFVYHVTHYFTLLLTQGPKIVSLVSDPFGWGWDLFGTAYLFRAPLLPDLGIVWHTQVGLILFGHIASVVVAHLVALRVFGSRRDALRSQVPMLALMMALTVAGLWILAQPLTELRFSR